MDNNYSSVVLLESIKNILYGIAWLLLGGILLLGGLIVCTAANGLIGFLLMFFGLLPLFAGILYIRWGYHNHTVEFPKETV